MMELQPWTAQRKSPTNQINQSIKSKTTRRDVHTREVIEIMPFGQHILFGEKRRKKRDSKVVCLIRTYDNG